MNPTIRRCFFTILLVSASATLVACGSDLPDGWDDAVTVDEFAADEIGETDWDDPELDQVHISGNLDRLEAAYLGSFPCTTALEGFQRIDGTDIDLLVQPTDLHPDAVAGSDCTFDIDFTVVGLDEGTYHVAIHRRDSDAVDETMAAVLVGEGDAVLGFAE